MTEQRKRGTDSIESPGHAFVDVAGSEQPVPKIITEPGPKYQDANRRFANVTTITKTPGGRLWCGFSGGGDGEGHLNYGMVVFSDDDGESWTSPQLVVDTDGEGPIRTDHMVVWTAPDGVLWVMFNQYPETLIGRRSSLWAITCDNPDDNHRQWSAPHKLVDEQNMLNRPTVLRDGTWIFPTGCWIRWEDADLKESRRRFPSRPLISRDQGETVVIRVGPTEVVGGAWDRTKRSLIYGLDGAFCGGNGGAKRKGTAVESW
ncbi:MAG: sialidase family protein [Candidatus Brocadiia bacterium]